MTRLQKIHKIADFLNKTGEAVFNDTEDDERYEFILFQVDVKERNLIKRELVTIAEEILDLIEDKNQKNEHL